MRIGQVFGVTIIVDVSWLFIFAIVSWALGSSSGPFHAVNVTPGVRALLAVVTALLFFASVLLHELAHSLVARSQGIPVKEIRLFIFGGASSLTEEPKAPLPAAWLAFAGPLTSLVLAVLCAFAASLLGKKGRRVLVLERNDRIGGCLRSDEITAPGFIHDVMATTLVLFLTSPAYGAIGKDLEARGFAIANSDLRS